MANPFDGEQLQDATWARADMARAHFDGVNLDGARFYAVLTGAAFTDTDLGDATFDDVNLAGASFANVNLANARFDDVNLAGASVTNANLSGVRLEGVNLSGVDVRDANYEGMRIEGVLVTDLLEGHAKA